VRRFWKGDENVAGDLGQRLVGSADLYQAAGRRPQASINFVTCHDGFTLHDLVSYNEKHNEANLEDNKDGANDNQSWNCGAEGETDDKEILALRERQKRNLLTTIAVSQGVPMINSGDELGRTQKGNNNVYCQDNELSWLDWNLDERKKQMVAFTQRLFDLRRQSLVLRRKRFVRGEHIWDSASKDMTWYRPDGVEMTQADWEASFTRSLGFWLGGDAIPSLDEHGQRILAEGLLVLINGHHEPVTFTLPSPREGHEWHLAIDTGLETQGELRSVQGKVELMGRSIWVMREQGPKTNGGSDSN
jgi:glycogen operon protein